MTPISIVNPHDTHNSRACSAKHLTGNASSALPGLPRDCMAGPADTAFTHTQHTCGATKVMYSSGNTSAAQGLQRSTRSKAARHQCMRGKGASIQPCHTCPKLTTCHCLDGSQVTRNAHAGHENNIPTAQQRFEQRFTPTNPASHPPQPLRCLLGHQPSSRGPEGSPQLQQWWPEECVCSDPQCQQHSQVRHPGGQGQAV
jgi:hypothetical protein